MQPIRQTVHDVDYKNNVVHVMSGKGNVYPVELNHYIKGGIVSGDIALVVKSNVTGKWLLVDVEHKYPYAKAFDVVHFPRTETNDLNIVEYWEYRAEFDKLSTDRERNELNCFLIKLFKTKYNFDPFHYRDGTPRNPEVEV